MTTRLRELIQKLGEAIHQSVIENEKVADVVQDIRRHGFDVLLMLEATVALNDLANKEGEQVEVPVGNAAEELPFTQNDLSFLRSLRISVTGEEEENPGPEAG